MITVNLQLKYGERAVRDAMAWYIPGAEPAQWLAEVVAWKVCQTAIRFLPLARSPEQRDACGALVIVAGTLPAEVSERCIPYGLLADRLYLPVEARLYPESTDKELGELLSQEYTYVWHPAAGLTAFEEQDALRMHDLLSFPPQSQQCWDWARPGISCNARLIALSPTETISFEQVLQAGQDDIGSQSDQVSELPRSPAEPQPGLISAAARQGVRLAAGIARWIAQAVPRGGAGGAGAASVPGWLSQMGQWAERQLAELSQRMSAARNREITRLLHLLESDPDQGLRYALPLGGDAHRGRGAPSSRLGERNPDFNLSQLGGGAAADFWDISADYQHRLVARYRELANREMQLGRHRRAAYIFAELLADYEAAAGALVQGHHWREAAVLYRQRLNRPGDAAECLVKGGLWMEAVSLYEELEVYEKAGDLYRQLDQIDNAHEQYRKAVKKHRLAADRLASARLLEEKLDAADEAIEELAAGWPHSHQADRCLRELFRTLGRLGRHEMTHQWVKGLPSQTIPNLYRISLLNILVDTAADYPDESVKRHAADATRILVSQSLQHGSPVDTEKLLSAIRLLVPEDRLLGRDCRRYSQEHRTPAARVPTAYAIQKTPRIKASFQLPGDGIAWRTAAACRNSFFAAGQSENLLVLARCSWRGMDHPLKGWNLEPAHRDSPIILAPYPEGRSVLVHVIGAPTFTSMQTFARTDNCSFITKAGAIAGMSRSLLAATRTSQGMTWLVESRNDELTLVAIGPQEKLISTQTIPHPEFTPEEFALLPSVLPIPLLSRGDRTYVAIAQHLLVFERDKAPETLEFPQRITGLTGSAPHTRGRIVVSLENGGEIYWDEFGGKHLERFASHLAAPLVCLNQGGYLIAVADQTCEVFATHRGRLRFVSELSDSLADPMAVLPGPDTDSFAIVSKQGIVNLYEIP